MSEVKTKATKAVASVNEVADLKNRLEQAKAELTKNSELVKDLKAIVKLFVEFKLTVGFPKKFDFLWVIKNYSKIVELLKAMLIILKTKSSELA